MSLEKEFDRVLEEYSAFSVKEVKRSVSETVAVDNGGSVEAKAAAYWTTLAPNVEDYSGSVARMIDAGSYQLIKGILWCGDVTVDRLKWGNEFLKKRTKPGSKAEVSPKALKKVKSFKMASFRLGAWIGEHDFGFHSCVHHNSYCPVRVLEDTSMKNDVGRAKLDAFLIDLHVG
ncbi:hypothetical protein Lser_V15G08518 [Lactuca serriola]